MIFPCSWYRSVTLSPFYHSIISNMAGEVWPVTNFRWESLLHGLILTLVPLKKVHTTIVVPLSHTAQQYFNQKIILNDIYCFYNVHLGVICNIFSKYYSDSHFNFPLPVKSHLAVSQIPASSQPDTVSTPILLRGVHKFKCPHAHSFSYMVLWWKGTSFK